MKASKTHVVLLSGGSGSRLWPLSNGPRAKQFLGVLRDEQGDPVSMAQRSFRMLQSAPLDHDFAVITCAQQADSLREQVEGDYELVIEPQQRDTAAAVMLAATYLADVQDASMSDIVIVTPIDAYAGAGYYRRLSDLDRAARLGEADVVLLGVEPTEPNERYGYVVPATPTGDVRPVRRFVEKPSEQEAAALIAQGALWNCGVFACRLGWLLTLVKAYAPGDASYEGLLSEYDALPQVTFDSLIMEGSQSSAVVAYSGEWKDLGTWEALADEMAEPVSGRVVGIETCTNTHVVNESGLPLVVAGLSDVMVVATADGLLVADKDASQSIKPLVEQVATEAPDAYDTAEWGTCRTLDSATYANGTRSVTRELVVKTGCTLPRACHERRSEIWTVTAGEGEAVVDGETRTIAPGDVVHIEAGQPHEVRAVSRLHIVEVQLGE